MYIHMVTNAGKLLSIRFSQSLRVPVRYISMCYKTICRHRRGVGELTEPHSPSLVRPVKRPNVPQIWSPNVLSMFSTKQMSTHFRFRTSMSKPLKASYALTVSTPFFHKKILSLLLPPFIHFIRRCSSNKHPWYGECDVMKLEKPATWESLLRVTGWRALRIKRLLSGGESKRSSSIKTGNNVRKCIKV